MTLTRTRLLALIAIALVACYATGLAGPFVLDDHVNLAPVWLWWSGQGDATVLFSSPSGPLGRPLPLLTFALNAQLGGTSAFGFKLVNLLLHLVNAVLVWCVLRRIVAHASTIGTERGPVPPEGIALALAAIWALHPQHVSSVLYVVQRMALFGAMAQFAAVLVYLEGRARLAREPRAARRLLFVVFPALVAFGLLGKETAALAPLLCAALELTLHSGSTRPREMRAFLLMFVALPVALGATLFLLDPTRLTAGYAGREFGLAQRLLTEPRVVLDYLVGWFLPTPSRLTLYRDGYPMSDGWLDPPATAIATAAWIGIAGIAYALRRTRPLFTAGIAWFGTAHLLESTLLPLEPYFEHRNYVASLGLLLAVWALLHRRSWARRVARVAPFVLLLTLGAATAWRAYQWSDLDRLLASEGPPAGEVSRRLQVDRAIRAFERGDVSTRDAALQMLADHGDGNASAAALWRAIFACDGEGRVQAAHLDSLDAAPPPVLTHNHLSWLGLLVRRTEAASCLGLDRARVLALLDRWEQHASQPPTPYAQQQLTQFRAALNPQAQ